MLDTEWVRDDAIVTDDERPGVRFVVTQDTDAEDPRSWLDDSGEQILIYRAARNYGIDNLCDAWTPVMEAWTRVYGDTGDERLALAVAQRYARMFHPEYAIALDSGHGYSQGDWWETVVTWRVTEDNPAELDPRLYTEAFHQWMRGDVYYVSVEYLTECDCCGGQDWEQRDEVFSCGGFYADDAEAAVLQYADQNNIPGYNTEL